MRIKSKIGPSVKMAGWLILFAFIEEKVYEITQDAYFFYLNKAKKKVTPSTEKQEN